MAKIRPSPKRHIYTAACTPTIYLKVKTSLRSVPFHTECFNGIGTILIYLNRITHPFTWLYITDIITSGSLTFCTNINGVGTSVPHISQFRVALIIDHILCSFIKVFRFYSAGHAVRTFIGRSFISFQIFFRIIVHIIIVLIRPIRNRRIYLWHFRENFWRYFPRRIFIAASCKSKCSNKETQLQQMNK